MKPVGFYFAHTAQYGKFWREVRGFVTLYMDWELGTRWPLLGPQHKVWIDLGMYTPEAESPEYISKVIDALRPKWDRIIALELRDEPPVSWTGAKLNKMAMLVKGIVRAKGLGTKPVGATFGEAQVFAGTRWQAKALDYVGVEAYLKKVAGESPADSAQRMREYIKRLLGRTALAKKLIMVGQAYDRRTKAAETIWDEPNLMAIQQPIFQAAQGLGDRLLALTLFAYARPGGTRDYPALKAEIKRLVA